MREADLAVLIKLALVTGLAARNLSAEVKQSYQPRQQGVPNEAALFFHHISTVRIGWPERTDKFNVPTGIMDHIETQRFESRYQINSLTPNNVVSGAIDYLVGVSSALQSNAMLELFLAHDVGIQHITEINNVYFVDDNGQNRTNPTLDIVLSHQETVTVPGRRFNKFISIFSRI